MASQHPTPNEHVPTAGGWLMPAGRWLARVEDHLPGVLIAFMTLLVAADVAMRYVLNQPIRGAAEIAAACFVWAVLIGGASASRRDMHVRVDLFERIRSPRTLLLFDTLTRVLSIAIAGTLAVFAVQFYLDSRAAELPLLGISYGYVVLAAPVGLALIAMHDVLFLVQNIQALRSPRETQERLLESRTSESPL